MTSDIKEEDLVVLKRAVSTAPSGSVGKVFFVYETEPTSYEVSFFDGTADSVSMWLERDEIEKAHEGKET